ncbi:MAG: amidohydrolase [Tannerella sp.]|jgi:predicted amidohydrolase|nr:amidohydrolase [Tannerella sp.]
MNESSLRIGIIQTDIVWEDRAANLAHFGALLRRMDGRTDLAVLPELFTTGSIRDPKLADPVDGETVATLRQWAKTYRTALAGSFMAAENGKCYNRAFFVTPEGDALYADKRHLFRMGGEDRCIEAGVKRLIVPYLGWNICPLVCYDLRFPVWSRNVANAYDLLLYSANWPSARSDVWQALLPARALENQAYVCGVNRTGIDGAGLAYHGGSAVYSPRGGKLADAGNTREILLTCTLEKSPLESLRAKFPVWKDADTFMMYEE